MTMDLLSDLGRFTPPVSAEDFGFDNLFSSNPAYDEARGPGAPDGDRFVPIEEFYELWDEDDEEDYWNRILHQDPDEPLAPGETRESVLASMQDTRLLIRVPVDYEPPLLPPHAAFMKIKPGEIKPVTMGVVKVAGKKFDKTAKRFVKAQTAVSVTVRRLKPMEPR